MIWAFIACVGWILAFSFAAKRYNDRKYRAVVGDNALHWSGLADEQDKHIANLEARAKQMEYMLQQVTRANDFAQSYALGMQMPTQQPPRPKMTEDEWVTKELQFSWRLTDELCAKIEEELSEQVEA